MRTSPVVRILVVLMLLTAPLSASVTLWVDEVGLKGWSGYSGRGMEPIRFTIVNDGPAEIMNLKVASVTLSNGVSAVDSVFQERLLIPSGKTQFMRLLSITPLQSASLSLSGDDGKVIAYATSAGVTRSVIRGHLVVVYCHDPLTVENVRRSAIQSGDNDMRTRKERELDFVRVDALETENWYYNSASAIILAEPLVATPEQKRTLELYVRSGGNLVVNAASAASTGFDAAYFSEANSVRMGIGQVYEVSNFDGQSLSSLSTELLDHSLSAIGTKFLAGGSSGKTVLEQIAWRMRFPKTRTMILLTVSYILLIGAVNFAILRRMGRLELGWITVPAVALLFTFAVVAYGLTRGFNDIRIDQAETYYMDTHSPTAYVYDGVRVTSPSRGDFNLELAPGDYLASNPNDWMGSIDRVHIGDDILDERRDPLRRTRNFTVEGSRVGVELSMMRWSYEEWFGKRFEDLKGTVTLSGKYLKNETGIRFKRAIVVDQNMDKVYDLGAVDATATAELSNPQRLLPREYVRLATRGIENSRELTMWDLASMTSMKKAFVGVAEVDDSRDAARVLDRRSQSTQTRLFVVGLE